VEGQLGKDMLGNDLLQVWIGCIRILLEQRTYLAVIGGEYGYGIVAVGIIILRHRRCSFHLFVKRPATPPEREHAAGRSWCYVLHVCNLCAMAMQMTRLWACWPW